MDAPPASTVAPPAEDPQLPQVQEADLAKTKAMRRFASDAFHSSSTIPDPASPKGDNVEGSSAEPPKATNRLLTSFIVTHSYFETPDSEALSLWLEEYPFTLVDFRFPFVVVAFPFTLTLMELATFIASRQRARRTALQRIDRVSGRRKTSSATSSEANPRGATL